MIGVALSAALLLGGGGMLLWWGLRGLVRARVLGAAARLALGSLLLGGAAVLGGVGLHLASYQRLTYEQPVAIVGFRSVGPERFRARLRFAAGDEASYDLAGDEWQLDARVLKWRGWMNLLGFDARFRLERLSGRYADVRRERSVPRTVHELGPAAGLDLWRAARAGGAWLPGVDAEYGSSVYLPMRDDATYEVRMTQSGLVARPLDPAAATAVHGWGPQGGVP